MRFPGGSRMSAMPRPGLPGGGALTGPGGSVMRAAGGPGGTAAVLPGPPLPLQRISRAIAAAADVELAVHTVPVLFQGLDFTTAGTLSLAASARVPLPAAITAAAELTIDVQAVGEQVAADVPFTTTGTLSLNTLPVLGPLGVPATTTGTLNLDVLPAFVRDAAAAADASLSIAVTPAFPAAIPATTAGTLSLAVSVVIARAAPITTEATLSLATVSAFARAVAATATATLGLAVVSKTNFTEPFAYSDGALPAGWVTLPYGTDTSVVPQVASGAARAKGTSTNNQNNQCAAVNTNVSAISDNHAVRATMLSAYSGLFCGLIVRADAAGQNFVLVVITTATGNCGIYSLIGGTLTRRTTTAAAFAASDIPELRASGSTYTLVKNPDTTATTMDTWADTGGLFTPGPTRRYGGLFHNSDRNIFGTQSYAPSLDNWNIHDL